MHLGQRLVISQALEVRYELEAQLYQSLNVKQKAVLQLKLYLKREGQLAALYRRALKRGDVRQYNKHGLCFEFALVRKREVDPSILESCGMAFSHCLVRPLDLLFFGRAALSRGSWLLFVVTDLHEGTTAEFASYAAVHERGEQITLGDHNLASKLEFAIARAEGKLSAYIDWIETNCPQKFVDIFSYQTHLDLPEDNDLLELLRVSASTEESQRATEFISGFEWPMSILRKLKLYEERSRLIEALTLEQFAEWKMIADMVTSSIKNQVEELRLAINGHVMSMVKRDDVRYLNRLRMDDIWEREMLQLKDVFVRKLSRMQDLPNYIEQISETGMVGGLPTSGEFSVSFNEVFALVSAQ